MRLLLRHGGLKRERHLRVVFQGEDAFALKKDSHGAWQIRQHPYHTDAVHHISGKTGHAFGDDQINFTAAAVSNHGIELVTMRKGSPADALISIDPDKRPVGVMHYKVFVVLLLQLIGGRLLDIVCGDTGIHGNPLFNVAVVEINRLFCGNEFVVLRVYRPMGSPSSA